MPTSFELVYGVGAEARDLLLGEPALASSYAFCGSMGISSDGTPKSDVSAVPVYSG